MRKSVLRRCAMLVLAMCMVLGLSLTAFAATGSITLDKRYIHAGETVTITASLDQAVENVGTLRYDLYFDADKFELVSSEKGDSHALWTLGTKVRTNKSGEKYYPMSVLDATSTGLTVNAGTIYTLTFKALETIDISDKAKAFDLRFANAAHPDNTLFTEEDMGPVHLVVSPAKSADKTYLTDFPHLVSDNLTLHEIVLDTTAQIKSQSWDGDTLNVVLAEGTADDTNVEAEFHVSMLKEDGEKGDYDFNEGSNQLTADDCNVHRVSGKIENGKLTLTGTFAQCTYCENEEDKVAYDLTFTPKTYTLNFTVEGSEEPTPVSHSITITESENGTVSADKTTALKDDTVTLTITPADGYKLDTLTVMAGGQNLTVTDNAFTMPDTDVTITATFASNAAPIVPGYTIALGESKTVFAGETVEIPVTIGHTDASVTTYNAFDVTLTYDPTMLKFDMEEITDLTITDQNGTLRILRYGESQNVGEVAFTLKFTALTAGQTNITNTASLVGISEGAIAGDANQASITTKTTGITVEGYTVDLPAGFTGEKKVGYGENYTFTANDNNYIYDLSATMGGETVTVKDNGDGSFTVSNVTGNLVITLNSKTGKTFNVTLTGLTGADQAQYMHDYTATVNQQSGYTYTITATIGGERYTGFSYDGSTGKVTVAGSDITGDLVITATGSKPVPSTYSVTFEGDAAGEAQGDSTVSSGNRYTFSVNKVEGYTYTVTATMGGKETTVVDNGDGSYTIANVTGNLVITVKKQTDLTVEVGAYLELDGKTVFLVKANGTLPDGYAYVYDGTAMFKSENYDGDWVYLVMVDNGTLTADEAKAKIVSAQMTFTTLSQTYDVNGTGKVDVNDAQLVYDLYNTKYPDFTKVSMEKFLKADTTGDGKVDVADAAAIVSEINNLR